MISGCLDQPSSSSVPWILSTVLQYCVPPYWAPRCAFSCSRKICSAQHTAVTWLTLRLWCAQREGAVRWLLDIAAEQEQKEMLLAYTFLWNGQHQPQPMAKEYAKHEVDSAIELFLRGDIQEDQQALGSSQVPFCSYRYSGWPERFWYYSSAKSPTGKPSTTFPTHPLTTAACFC